MPWDISQSDRVGTGPVPILVGDGVVANPLVNVDEARCGVKHAHGPIRKQRRGIQGEGEKIAEGLNFLADPAPCCPLRMRLDDRRFDQPLELEQSRQSLQIGRAHV